MKLINLNSNTGIFDIFNNYLQNEIVDYSYKPIKSNSLLDETDESYFITLEMPGFDKSNIDITINDDIISIVGERKNDIIDNSDYKIINYDRSYHLPENIQANKIKAECKNGILYIDIPKVKKVKKDIKKIEIK